MESLEKVAKVRLSKNVLPKHYNLILEPNLKDLTFIGKLDIRIEIKDME